ADGSVASSTRYDTYAAVANATAMSNAIAAIPNDTFVIVTNYDSIGVNLAPVKNALISLSLAAQVSLKFVNVDIESVAEETKSCKVGSAEA
ncbi:interleukin-like EMT inducer domain-containing protein, partial [Bacillus sp. B-TM1]